MGRKKKEPQAAVRYEVFTQEDPETGDVILPIPPELLERMGWSEGDTLEWKQADNGTWILSKETK